MGVKGDEMDKHTIEKIAELLKQGEWSNEITEVEVFYNMEGDWVVSYKQDDQKKLITIDYI